MKNITLYIIRIVFYVLLAFQFSLMVYGLHDTFNNPKLSSFIALIVGFVGLFAWMDNIKLTRKIK